MIDLGLSARDKKTLIAGATVVGSLFGLSRGLPAVSAWERGRLALAADLASQAAAARAGVRSLTRLRDTLRARQRRLAALDSTLLGGASSAAAAADLASVLDDIARASRLKVAAMQLRADSAPPGALALVAVRIAGVTDVAGLAAFLRSVETDDTPLAVRELAVSQSEPAAPEGTPEALRVDVLVEGLARISPEKKP